MDPRIKEELWRIREASNKIERRGEDDPEVLRKLEEVRTILERVIGDA